MCIQYIGDYFGKRIKITKFICRTVELLVEFQYSASTMYFTLVCSLICMFCSVCVYELPIRIIGMCVCVLSHVIIHVNTIRVCHTYCVNV